MGEYLHLHGRTSPSCKLGTMDDFRYVRRDEGECLVGAEGDGDGHTLAEALKDPQTLWRFPWPGEDRKLGALNAAAIADGINAREMFDSVIVRVPDAILGTFDHQTRWVPMSPSGFTNSWNVNVAVPCPLDPKADPKLRHSPASPILAIYGERVDESGTARTIFRCAYCESPCSFPAEMLAEFEPVAGCGDDGREAGAAIKARFKGRTSPVPAVRP